MNILSRRAAALALILIMLISLCSCTEKLDEQSVVQAEVQYRDDLDELYKNLSAAFPDIVSESDYIAGAAVIEDAFNVHYPCEKASQEEYSAYIDDIARAYGRAACALTAPVLSGINESYSRYYQTLFGSSDEVVSFSDAIAADISAMEDFDDMRTLAAEIGDRYFDSYKCELIPENADKFAVKAYLSKEKDATVVLVANFDIPRIREQNNAFALDLYSSAAGVQFSYPDTLYNYDAISYSARNIAEIDMSKVIGGCQFADIFKAYKRITFILFAVDNSYSAEIDLSDLRSDDYPPDIPDKALIDLQNALGI